METTKVNGNIKLWWLKVTKPFRKLYMRILLADKKALAKWKQKQTGVTQYVIALNWHTVRVMDKPQFEYCRKFIQKKRGKDLRNNIMYRADGTLVRNPNFVERL